MEKELLIKSLSDIVGAEHVVTEKAALQDAAKDYIANATTEELADLYVEYMTIPEDDYIQEMIVSADSPNGEFVHNCKAKCQFSGSCKETCVWGAKNALIRKI